MRFLFTFLVILFVTSIFAQKVVVGLPTMNVIYIGLKNEIKIAVEGHTNSELVFETRNAKLSYEGEKLFITSIIRGDAYVYVGVKKTIDTLWLDTARFRVRRLLLPNPQLGTLQDGDIHNLATIRANANRVYLSLGEGFAVEGIKITVISYDFTLVDSLGFETVHVAGANTPTQILNKMTTLSAGAKLILSNFEYFAMQHSDTVLRPTKLAGEKVILTVRQNVNSFFPTESEIEAYDNFSPTYQITGSFCNSSKQYKYNSLLTSDDYLLQFVNKTKHGTWQYYTGIGAAKRLYMQEYYDSGEVLSYIAYDSIGNVIIDSKREAGVDSMYIKEVYNNGNTKREGWVYTNLSRYGYWGEISKSYHGNESNNPYKNAYQKMRFVPMGEWKEFHENGTLKLKATFKTLHDYKYFTYYDEYLAKGFNVFIDGLWAEYDDKGVLLNTYKYEDGYYIEPKK